MGNLSSKEKAAVETVKNLMTGNDTAKVLKHLKKHKISFNTSSIEFGCSCHGEEVTLMHYAAAVCPSVMVILACDMGRANVDSKATSNGVTPLMYAVIHKNSDNILPLCLRKCNLNAHDNSDEDTAFH